MTNELSVLTAPKHIVSAEGVITAESPMTDEEFNKLKSLFTQLRTPVSDRGWKPNYYTEIAHDILKYTEVLCDKYSLPKTGGRYYVVFLETGGHLQWWSEVTLARMGYYPAIGGN